MTGVYKKGSIGKTLRENDMSFRSRSVLAYTYYGRYTQIDTVCTAFSCSAHFDKLREGRRKRLAGVKAKYLFREGRSHSCQVSGVKETRSLALQCQIRVALAATLNVLQRPAVDRSSSEYSSGRIVSEAPLATVEERHTLRARVIKIPARGYGPNWAALSRWFPLR